MLGTKILRRITGVFVFGLMAANCARAVPVFSYYNDTPDPTIYKYLIFNPVSSFEVSHVEMQAAGATAISSPAGWTGTLAGGIATWQTILGASPIGPGEEITGFELVGSAAKTIQSYKISGPQFEHEDVVIVPVPEPGSLLAIGSGLIGLIGLMARRRYA
ncbi:MAG: PEP-CTERM sorting domain-containing protein [Armatimonadetes bacterium]|nr:PEP-CTERM sorting domain-containing protein [Armatimonadota bacterium]